MSENSKIPILVGPTGVGKSEVAYHLALKLKAEIISADAFQVYAGTEVGTAYPPKEWREKVPHYLIGTRRPSETWNAVQFAQEAVTLLQKKKLENKKVLVVGGAGFYLKALVQGAPAGTAPDPEVREMVSAKVAEMGNEAAHDWLQSRDPEAAQRLHPNDLQRICRALEKTFTSDKEVPRFEPLGEGNVLFLGLERSRENLDRALLQRTQAMWEGGLLEETENLMALGLPEDHPLWGAIGYLEGAAFLRKKITREEAQERMYRRTRQYAKRQWTWFKHQHKVEWINLDEFPETSALVSALEKRLANE
jgi:tRNA dimethylallyltransferase